MPSVKEKVNKTHLDFRIPVESKAIIEQAASLSGQTVSDFAVSILVKSAQEVISQHQQTKLSLRDSDIFLKMLESDGEPSEALKKAVANYKEKNL